MNVAVTGVGGGVGQSIMKALSVSSLKVNVHPIDVQPFSAGLYRASEGAVLPKPEGAGALQAWERWLVDKHIDALIPGSDFDLLPLATVRDDWQARGICHVLVSNLDLVRNCRDKAATCQMLQQAGLPAPNSAWDLPVDSAVSWAREVGYPVVLKPRDGSASRHLHVVGDEEELRFYYPRTPNPLLQEYLGSPLKADEFTCAVFVDRDGVPLGTFMARRDLSGGSTYRAEIGRWPEIQSLLIAIGTALKPRGPLNVQLRMTPRGPVPFELNVRCSGTTAIRAYFGYNEPEMLLQHYFLGEALTPPTPRQGYALRYWNEVFLKDASARDLQDNAGKLKGDVLAWP